MLFFKKIVKSKIENLFDYLALRLAKNIDIELQRIALRQTAEFVLKSGLIKAKAFNNRFELLKYAIKEIRIEGLILEFGVYKGETINFIADMLPNRVIYGFDSFEGLPETWRYDFEEKTFALTELPKVRKNVKLIKGWFKDTLPNFVKETGETPVAFIHIDCDLYSSTKEIFENLREKILPGTIIVFDEFFNYPSWEEHEYRAFMEFVENNNVVFEWLGFVKYHEQVAVRILEIE